jgi:hypothetical protein
MPVFSGIASCLRESLQNPWSHIVRYKSDLSDLLAQGLLFIVFLFKQ